MSLSAESITKPLACFQNGVNGIVVGDNLLFAVAIRFNFNAGETESGAPIN